jgi:hypothetical protein
MESLRPGNRTPKPNHAAARCPHAGEEEEEEAEADEGCDGEEEQRGLLRTESAAHAATYWEALLKEHWQLLQKEEEEALARAMAAQQALDGDADGSPKAAAGTGGCGLPPPVVHHHVGLGSGV